MSKQKIVSIEIELKDYEPIKFTMAEAKELHEQLDALFGAKVTHDHYHTRPWCQPYYTWYNTGSPSPLSTFINTNSAGIGLSDLVGKSAVSSDTNMKVSYLAANNSC